MLKENLNDKAVVITGTSTGIGWAAARYLDKLGYTVFAGVRKEKDVDALRKTGSEKLIPVMIDMLDGDTIQKAFEQVSTLYGKTGLVGLVNNAGMPLGGPLEYFDLELIRNGMEVNLVGHINLIQTFLPLLRKQGGRIINIGSIGGIFPAPFNAPYNASKAALHVLTHTLRRELLSQGIHVTLIIPGNIKTAIWGKIQDNSESIHDNANEYYGQALRSMQRVTKKMGSQGIPPESVAKVILKALTRKRPKTQYIVGMDARIQSIASIVLPNSLLDRVLMGMLGK